MHPQDLEPETEALLLRLLPELPLHWHGASEEEIARMEAIAGRPLPRFYRWFLSRMGREMGPITYRSLEFSVAKVLSCYDAGLVRPNPRFLLIGYENDEVMPLHLFYDFDFPARDDARVVKRHFLGGPIYNSFDTFREKLAWGEFLVSRVEKLPQRCEGSFRGTGDVVKGLDSVMESLGFKKLIPTGDCCALYDREDAAMSISRTPAEPPNLLHFFDLAGPTTGMLRRILGTIGMETRFDIEIESWTPPLPSHGGAPRAP